MEEKTLLLQAPDIPTMGGEPDVMLNHADCELAEASEGEVIEATEEEVVQVGINRRRRCKVVIGTVVTGAAVSAVQHSVHGATLRKLDAAASTSLVELDAQLIDFDANGHIHVGAEAVNVNFTKQLKLHNRVFYELCNFNLYQTIQCCFGPQKEEPKCVKVDNVKVKDNFPKGLMIRAVRLAQKRAAHLAGLGAWAGPDPIPTGQLRFLDTAPEHAESSGMECCCVCAIQ